MLKTILEVSNRTLFLSCPLGAVWAERLSGGASPGFPHPEGRRWGCYAEDHELLVYLGPLHVILTSPTRPAAQV
ncbi:hypothetical protein GGR33_003102 [Methylobacterium brachythecii]|uniref:Uncharacterized protein n=1 Tax=Methylobacterium brachythecii TaxID=1176177 RepID=A0A7W6AHT0_9HYPH|nr:hypothetical protein [Methylobacterium brachythecii]GLS44055.1 hypothetical protein GCM10007884_20420 [Methylobacterium brachythecii]